jgi:hypothetical protein
LVYLYPSQNSQSVIVFIRAARTPGRGLARMGCPISLRAAARPVLVSRVIREVVLPAIS